tara:strand:+ start:1988 stop:2215 length:228 start_codon:yes stop_codon:yes gene_type:complete
MDDEVHFQNHIEILSIIKDKLNNIPDEMMTWDDGEDFDNAQFVYLQFLKVVIDEESDKWIKHYEEQWLCEGSSPS